MGMKSKVMLGMLAVGTIAGSAAFYVSDDRQGPAISFGADAPVYDANGNQDDLLSNVTAIDNIDGDVTSSVYVDYVRLSKDGNKAVVTYVVLDSKHNVSRASQVLACGDASETVEEDTEGMDWESTEEVSGVNAASEQEDLQEDEEQQDEEQADNDNTNPEDPVLKLKQKEATIGINDNFNYGSYIESIEDDKDDFSTLSKRLRIDGDYKTKAAGTYELTFYLTDTDGNSSNRVPIRLIRQ